MIPADYVTVAYVDRRNGAWLISLAVNSFTEDLGHHELVDCAGSLALARRIARADAAEAGFDGPYRWEEVRPGRGFILHARRPEEYPD